LYYLIESLVGRVGLLISEEVCLLNKRISNRETSFDDEAKRNFEGIKIFDYFIKDSILFRRS
jgi:hypothetical protein